MDTIFISAPGKVILHGEHSVVYGKPAIAGSLNLRTHLKVSPQDDGVIRLILPDVKVKKTYHKLDLPVNGTNTGNVDKPEPATEQQIQELKFLAEPDKSNPNLAVVAFLFLYSGISSTLKKGLPSIDVHVVSDLPIGAGLGSSASFSVCLAASLLCLAGHVKPNLTNDYKEDMWSEKDLKLINQWAFLCEKIIHGNPSGVDNSVATFGGAIQFQKGLITPILKMPSLTILIVNTRVARSTKDLVSRVRQRYDKYKSVFQPVLESMEAIVKKSCEAYAMIEADHQQYDVLEDMITTNQCLLRTLGVSHVKLDLICSIAREYNITSKLTGAGGGGCAYCLIKPSISDTVINQLISRFLLEGFECWKTSVGGAGVIYHSHSDIQAKFNTEKGSK